MRTLAVPCVAAFLCMPLSARVFGQTASRSTPLHEQQVKPEPVQQQVTVYATRTDGRLEDQPTHVELLDQDEVDEKQYKAYINAENLGNVRQTKYDSLLRPARAPDGRWTTDAWAPLDGRIYNGGIRARF